MLTKLLQQVRHLEEQSTTEESHISTFTTTSTDRIFTTKFLQVLQPTTNSKKTIGATTTVNYVFAHETNNTTIAMTPSPTTVKPETTSLSLVGIVSTMREMNSSTQLTSISLVSTVVLLVLYSHLFHQQHFLLTQVHHKCKQHTIQLLPP